VRGLEPRTKIAESREGANVKKMVCISNGGDDKNDGFKTPVYSWKRALKLKGGDNSIDVFIDGAATKRISKEIAKAEPKWRRWKKD
jgi:hypothetical protein